MITDFDVAVGVIVVINISAKMTDLCYRYSQEIANAKSNIERLKIYVERLLNTFKELQKTLNDQHKNKLKATQYLRIDIDFCSFNIYNLKNKLKISKNRKVASSRLTNFELIALSKCQRFNLTFFESRNEVTCVIRR